MNSVLKPTMFDGLAYVLSHFIEFLKLFALNILLLLLMAAVLMAPILQIASLFILLYIIIFNACGVHDVIRGKKIDFSVFKDAIDFIAIMPSELVKNYLVMILVSFIGVAVKLSLTGAFTFLPVPHMTATVIQYLIIAADVITVALVAKFYLKCQLCVIDKLALGYTKDVEFTKGLFKYRFIWLMIPVVSIIAQYALVYIGYVEFTQIDVHKIEKNSKIEYDEHVIEDDKINENVSIDTHE